MNVFLLDHEVALRLGVFGGVFGVMGTWESIAPRRKLTTPKGARWLRNLSLTLLNGICVRLVVPLQAVGVAALAAKNGWGLLQVAGVHPVVAIAGAIVALDLAIYVQHWYFHRNPLLWRLHMVHHVDLDIDVTTGVRFHPLEILLSMAIKMAFVLLVGAPVAAVVLFEILLNATAMFNHGNVRMGAAVDRALRTVLVTPDMHRVHHSVIPRETFSNFGFNVPWWDRLFGTYRPQPEAGHDGMIIGLPWFRDPGQVALVWLLLLPFRKSTGHRENRRAAR